MAASDFIVSISSGVFRYLSNIYESLLRKWVTANNLELFSQNTPSQIFDRILNMSLLSSEGSSIKDVSTLEEVSQK